jgi:hypothetical protein
LGANGHDYYISADVTAGGDTRCSPNPNGWLYSLDIDAGWVSRDYATGKNYIYNMFGYSGTPFTGYSHISGKAFDAPGLVVVSTYGCPSNCSALADSVFLVELATSAITPLARLNNAYFTYYSEPHASISRDGTKVIVNTDWGTSGDESRIDAYIIDVR